MKYRQITSEERYQIAALRQVGDCPAAIARQMGRHRSTISKELQRNCSPWDGSYCPSKAQEQANGRRSRSRRNRRFGGRACKRVVSLLQEKWSPEQVSGSLRKNGLSWQYLPKRKSMAHVTERDCTRIAKKLNTRPRKRYDYETSEERFHAA